MRRRQECAMPDLLPAILRPALLLGLVCLRLAASEAAATPDELRAKAEALRALGETAMAEMGATPARAIDAALAFSQVLAIDRKLGDSDDEANTEANLFWCKKHMDLDDLKVFLAKRASGVQVQVPEASATDQPVTADQAEAYFTRAEAYAKAHPDRPLQVAVRYFEVAERFQGTPFALSAQRLSLEAQQRAMAQEKGQGGKAADTLFTKPAEVAESGARRPVPAADALKAATATIKDTFKEEYAQARHAKRGAFPAKLIAQALATSDDATMRYALLDQAREQAIAGADPVQALAAVDQIAAGFTGSDALPARKQALGRIHLPAAQGMLKLLDNPEDADANTVVGRFYACELQQWPVALPLLQHGGDAALKKLATMELSNPEGGPRQGEIADGWYEQARKASEGKDALLAHALTWYRLAITTLDGMSKSAADKRIADILGTILMDGITDWNNLTAAQWERVRSPIVEVAVGKARNEVPPTAHPAGPYRILPQPADTWSVLAMGMDDPVTWRGDAQKAVGAFQAGELVMALGAEVPRRLGDVDKAQPLALMAATDLSIKPAAGAFGNGGGGGGRRGGGFGGNGPGGGILPGKGAIRVKFMAIEGQ
jgi:hypothetical protein